MNDLLAERCIVRKYVESKPRFLCFGDCYGRTAAEMGTPKNS
jgi:hypothetical protein